MIVLCNNYSYIKSWETKPAIAMQVQHRMIYGQLERHGNSTDAGEPRHGLRRGLPVALELLEVRLLHNLPVEGHWGEILAKKT